VAGSLANPASPEIGVRGVYSSEMVMPLALTMREMGYRRGMVAHGLDASGERGMDELSTLGRSIVAEFHEDGEISRYEITPQSVGLPSGCERDILSSLDRGSAATRFVKVLLGEEKGSRRDIVALNAAPILYLDGKASSLSEGVAMAMDIIESGKGMDKLKDWVRAQSSEDPGAKLERLERMSESPCPI
jgi:anthranilate phosphoribosyltransferase